MVWSTNACCFCTRSLSAAPSRRCLVAYDSTSSCLTTDDSTTAWSTSATRSDTPPDTCAGQRQMSAFARRVVALVPMRLRGRHSHMSIGYRIPCVRLFDLGAAQQEQSDD